MGSDAEQHLPRRLRDPKELIRVGVFRARMGPSAAAQSRPQRLAVVGLGYVGTTVAVKFAEAGFDVVGIDIDRARCDAIGRGTYPLAGDEPGMADLLGRVVQLGRLRATPDFDSGTKDVDAFFVCVPTPFEAGWKEPNYTALRSALSEIGRRLRPGMMVIVESTLAPSTMERIVKPLLEQSSHLKAGAQFDLVHCPERVMPGHLLRNLSTLPRVIGGVTPASAERAKALYSRIVAADLDLCDLTTAEMVKTVENSYRYVQIAFANEVALLSERLNIDAFQVRALVNKSPERSMHVPGAGVGGPCVPKDTRLLAYAAGDSFVPHLLTAASRVNDFMPNHVAELACEGLRRLGRSPQGSRVLVLGASYLPETGELRDSPVLPLIEALKSTKIDLLLHDPLAQGTLGGVPVERELPEESLRNIDAVVLATAHGTYRQIDLARWAKQMRTRLLVDGRNFWPRAEAERHGFLYLGVGHGVRSP